MNLPAFLLRSRSLRKCSRSFWMRMAKGLLLILRLDGRKKGSSLRRSGSIRNRMVLLRMLIPGASIIQRTTSFRKRHLIMKSAWRAKHWLHRKEPAVLLPAESHRVSGHRKDPRSRASRHPPERYSLHGHKLLPDPPRLHAHGPRVSRRSNLYVHGLLPDPLNLHSSNGHGRGRHPDRSSWNASNSKSSRHNVWIRWHSARQLPSDVQRKNCHGSFSVLPLSWHSLLFCSSSQAV